MVTVRHIVTGEHVDDNAGTLADAITDILRHYWEDENETGFTFIMDGKVAAILATREVTGLCAGIVEDYRPGQGVRTVAVAYILTTAGGYDHTVLNGVRMADADIEWFDRAMAAGE